MARQTAGEPNKNLTAKQEKFAVAYVRLGNASAAYREAYSAKKMADESVRVEASRMLAAPNIALRIAELFKPAAESAQLSAEKTLEHIALGAYSSPADPPTWAEKLNALDKAAKHLGLYEKDNSQRGPDLALQIVMMGAA